MKRLVPILCIVLALMLVLTACGTLAELLHPEDMLPQEAEPGRGEGDPADAAPEEEPEEEAPQEAPGQPAAPLQELSLTDDQRYELNIFLSNFSEQNFRTIVSWNNRTNTYDYMPDGFFDARNADPMELIQFTWTYGKINLNATENVTYEGLYYYGVDISTLNSLSMRFFNRSLSISDVKTGKWMENIGYSIVAVGDKVCTPAADGDTYSGLSIADHLYDLGDGTMQAEFTVYEATDYGSEGITSIGGINSKSIYNFTAEEAADHPDLERHLSGTAILRPYTMESGRETYQLITYELHE